MAFVGRDGGVNPTLETLIRLAPLGTPRVLRRAVRGTVIDCTPPARSTKNIPTGSRPSPPFRGEREGPVAQRREGEVGGAAHRLVGSPHPTLSPRPAGGEG